LSPTRRAPGGRLPSCSCRLDFPPGRQLDTRPTPRSRPGRPARPAAPRARTPVARW
jgi:hypothetical protein